MKKLMLRISFFCLITQPLSYATQTSKKICTIAVKRILKKISHKQRQMYLIKAYKTESPIKLIWQHKIVGNSSSSKIHYCWNPITITLAAITFITIITALVVPTTPLSIAGTSGYKTGISHYNSHKTFCPLTTAGTSFENEFEKTMHKLHEYTHSADLFKEYISKHKEKADTKNENFEHME